LCREAVDYATEHFHTATVAIDSWGVDNGFVDLQGNLIQDVVCYRDLSHDEEFKAMEADRPWLYQRTGIQHQPFNTVYQLMARRRQDPTLPTRSQMLLLPDLLGSLLGGGTHYEATEASTTQLMGLDNRWDDEVFRLVGWPSPHQEPMFPGRLGPEISHGIRLAHVGSHDTASAVAGFGHLADDEMFVNVGTWSLAGTIIERPIATPAAEAAGFTNERTADGRVRLLRNIPGFYVVNRLHEELRVAEPIPEWLSSASAFPGVVNLFRPEFFNPRSMIDACAADLEQTPSSSAEWAFVALASLCSAVAAQPMAIRQITGRQINRIRVGGGGSQSIRFCEMLAASSGLPVTAGPAEATLIGNIATQFKAAGHVGSWQDMAVLVGSSNQTAVYRP
jgi:rhamnulokinase